MEPENLTLRILTELRDEMAGVRDEMRGVRTELAGLHESQDQCHLRLGVIESTVLETATQIRVISRATRVTLDAKQAHEDRFDDLENRVSELEQRGKPE